MQSLCQLGPGNIWTGESQEVADTAGCPVGWVNAAPPELPAGDVAQWVGAGWVFVPQAAQASANLAPARAAASASVSAQFTQLIAAGYPTGGLHVAIDDGSFARLLNMALTAMGAMGEPPGGWPTNYQTWFTIEGPAIPLPTPADGIALAHAAGLYHSQAVVNEAALLAQIAAADDLPTLQAIDPNSGWPTGA